MSQVIVLFGGCSGKDSIDVILKTLRIVPYNTKIYIVLPISCGSEKIHPAIKFVLDQHVCVSYVYEQGSPLHGILRVLLLKTDLLLFAGDGEAIESNLRPFLESLPETQIQKIGLMSTCISSLSKEFALDASLLGVIV